MALKWGYELRVQLIQLANSLGMYELIMDLPWGEQYTLLWNHKMA